MAPRVGAGVRPGGRLRDAAARQRGAAGPAPPHREPADLRHRRHQLQVPGRGALQQQDHQQGCAAELLQILVRVSEFTFKLTELLRNSQFVKL